MQITINDTPRQIPDNFTIRHLLSSLNINGPVAVELNRQVCPKRLHDKTILKDNDVLEIVTIVGGG